MLVIVAGQGADQRAKRDRVEDAGVQPLLGVWLLEELDRG